MAQEKTITIRLEKATKNTIKYEEVPADGEPPVYLQKWFAGANPAQEWEVTFRAKNGAQGK